MKKQIEVLTKILNGQTAKDSHARTRIACLVGFGTLLTTLCLKNESLMAAGGKTALIISLESGRQFANRIIRDLRNNSNNS